jgi:hypothetical protein
MKKTYLFSFIFITFVIASFKFTGKTGLAKVNTNDDAEFININNIKMWESNNGNLAHDPFYAGQGLYWPYIDGLSGYQPSMIYQAGLLMGGKINGKVHISGATFNHGLQAGKILENGKADNPEKPQYRIYKIRENWEELPDGEEKSQFEKDYNEWPVEDGAPWVDVDSDGVFTRGIDTPEFIGEEVMWYVANDLDSIRTKNLYGTAPMGLEVQSLTFAFNDNPYLRDMIFKSYTVINKSGQTIDSMYFSLFNDTDLGTTRGDMIGIDTILQMGYGWNEEYDDIYKDQPPAHGFALLDTPNGHKVSAFILLINSDPFYRDATMRDTSGANTLYNNYFKGKMYSGKAMTNPSTGKETPIWLPGDPVTSTGWYYGDGWPDGPRSGNIRYVMTLAPFTFAPGDTQKITFAIIVGSGENNLKSIADLRSKARYTQDLYRNNFKMIEPQKPILKANALNGAVKISWDNSNENFEKVDPLLRNKDVDDSTYSFEGYRLWQYRDINGADPKLLDIFDLENDVIKIRDFMFTFGERSEVTLFISPNEGLQHSKIIRQDAYSKDSLYNGSPYYFGVTSYIYSEESDPRFIESKPSIIEVIPNSLDSTGVKLDQISVFPNPYLGIDPFGRFPNQNFMRFINLPQKVIMRIYTISGQLVWKIEKENSTPWLDWDLKNLDDKVVASGIYIAHLEMPQIGKKIMKLAVVQDNR